MHDIFRFLIKYSPRTAIVASLTGIVAGGASAVLVVMVNRQLTGGRWPWSWGWIAVAFTALLIAVSGLNLLSRVLLIRMMQDAEYEMRLDLTRRILATPLRQLEELGSARLFAVLTQDVANLSAALIALPNLSINAAMLAGCLVYLAWLSWPVLIALLVVLGVTMALNMAFDRRALHLLMQARGRFDQMLEDFRSLTEGIKELKLHTARTRALLDERVQPNTAELRQRNADAFEAYAVGSTWGQVVFFIFVGFLVFCLPRLIVVPLALVTSYTVTVLFARGPIMALVDAMPNMRRAGVALRTIERLALGGDVEPYRAAATAAAPAVRRVQLAGITHTYYRELEEDNFVLGPIDLCLQAGELVFLVGGNGSGKTTVCKVLCGLYPPELGAVLMDGRAVDATNRNDYRNLFSVVFSEFFLFESLLGMGSGPSLDAAAERYLAMLQLDHKVRVEAGALSTTELSRGQRKRLALLTAYLEDRPFYIFDEWAADQDPFFKDIFYRQLLPDLRRRGKGVLVISHDSHYHGVADRIVRLNYGAIESEEHAAATLATAGLAAGAAALAPAAPSS
jgi:putative pyoverdin transport system ATP-binding/permease protein